MIPEDKEISFEVLQINCFSFFNFHQKSWLIGVINLQVVVSLGGASPEKKSPAAFTRWYNGKDFRT